MTGRQGRAETDDAGTTGPANTTKSPTPVKPVVHQDASVEAATGAVASPTKGTLRLDNSDGARDTAVAAPELEISDEEFAEVLDWIQSGAVEDAYSVFDPSLLTPIQVGGASLLDPLTPLGNERRMGDYLEGIGKRYGSYIDGTALRTGRMEEIGGIVGLYEGELVASPIYSSRQSGRRDGLMNLGALRGRLEDQYPGFVALYDWHFHASEGLRYHPQGYPAGTVAEVLSGFSGNDVTSTGASSLRGSYLLTPNSLQYMSNSTADSVPRGYGYSPPQPVRQWAPVNSPWPWRWPH